MAEHIPFITSKEACHLVRTLYHDSEIVRVPLDGAAKLLSLLPSTSRRWVDPGIDGMDDIEKRRFIGRKDKPRRPNPWFTFMAQCATFERVGSDLTAPVPGDVTSLVNAILDKCADLKPTWITVPQVPLVDNAARNRVNRLMAAAAGKWKSKRNFSGHLILPLVFTNQRQINSKTARNKKVQQAERCYREAQAYGFWVVDKSLNDESGSRTLRNTRLPAIVCLHQELNERIASKIRIAGPYWAMNLVLWARDLVDYPAIGIGLGYQYSLPGGPSMPPAPRLALSPLRRRTGLGQLGPWLDQVLSKLGASHPAYPGFEALRSNLSLLSAQPSARKQVARFYKKWFDSIAAAPKAGRSMALFQDLSAAYALGKSLVELNAAEGTARRPEAVAEPLMLNCL